jgi:hypothetical protein
LKRSLAMRREQLLSLTGRQSTVPANAQ